jgi:hypothetical protein
MTLAERTREAARDWPFLVDALRAGIVNYSAAARYLDVDGDTDAVATALRRFANDLPDAAFTDVDVRVSMERGVGKLADPDDVDALEALLVVSGTTYAAVDDGQTAILATGDVDVHACREALAALAVKDVPVDAFAFGDDTFVVLVPKLDSANALRAVEDALDAVPTQPAVTDRR